MEDKCCWKKQSFEKRNSGKRNKTLIDPYSTDNSSHLPPHRPWPLLHMKTAIFTSFPTGMPLPSPAVRPTTLATKALRVRYSLRTTPLIMVLSSGIPDPENNSRAEGEQNLQANERRKKRQTETDLAMPSALTNSLWRHEVAENGRKQNKNKWVCDPCQILQRNIWVQLSVHPLVGCRQTKKELSVTTAAPNRLVDIKHSHTC